MKSFLLIGAGNFGHLLARELSKQPCELMIADISEHALEDLLELGISAKIGDCKREEVLESFDVASFDACFVCVGGHFQTSLEIVYLLSSILRASGRDDEAEYYDERMFFLLPSPMPESIPSGADAAPETEKRTAP